MAALAKIAERHPRLKLHSDDPGRHGGDTGGTDDAAFADLPEMVALARFPNVAVKMSGAPSQPVPPRIVWVTPRNCGLPGSPKRMSLPTAVVGKIWRRVREAAGPDFERGYAEGQSLTLDGAVALALPPAESVLAALYPEPRPQFGYTIVRSMMRRSSGW